MCGKYGNHTDTLDCLEYLVQADAGIADADKRSSKSSGLRMSIRVKLCGTASAFAMVCFGNVRQFEINTKSLREFFGIHE